VADQVPVVRSPPGGPRRGCGHQLQPLPLPLCALRLTLWALSEALLVAQLARIKASPYYSILADSSTDVSLEEHLLLYVRFIDPVTFVCDGVLVRCPLLGQDSKWGDNGDHQDY
jgi:hypothetical protein